MCTTPTQCWAHGAARPAPMLALEGLSRHPHLSPSHMPSVTHAHVARTHYLYTACTVWALPCAACAPPSRCLCATCALPVLCLCAAMSASVHCLYIRLWATCTSLSPCPMFPLHPFTRPMHANAHTASLCGLFLSCFYQPRPQGCKTNP